jgi:uncharacterized protein
MTSAAATATRTPPASLEGRVDALAWDELRRQLDSRGFAVTPPLLAEQECQELSDLFDGGRFRSTIEMARHRFGDGRYRYFDRPLPEPITGLRGSLYRHLAPIAEWSGLLGAPATRSRSSTSSSWRTAATSARSARLLSSCATARVTGMHLHQDLYGEVYFPFQVVTVLSEPSVEPARGGFVIFPTRHRPQQGSRGYHGVGLRHGVSTITRGQRTALGIIFHDAR